MAIAMAVAVTNASPHRGADDGADLFCAVMNPATGTYIDLSPLAGEATSVAGWTGGANFTVGVCSSPVAPVDRDALANTTGAYYVDPATGQPVSIGDYATRPRLSRGRKLTLQYDGGSVCPNGVDRKSAVLSFACDRELASRAQIAFVASVHDCAYFFEVRSVHACPTSPRSNEVNVLGIFVGIFAVFFLVEFGGRRWLYGKVKGYAGGSPTRAQARPAWHAALGRLIARFAPRSSEGPISLRSSREAFLRDMERQNEVLDALEVNSTETDASRSSPATQLL